MAGATPSNLDTTGGCILALDGGGVKGLSSLYILRGIMHEVNKQRELSGKNSVKPCEVFDLICGTSTGGLIAIMLGRLEMSVDECIESYNSMCERVFKNEGRKVKISGSKGLKFWKYGKDDVHTKSAFDYRVLEACVLETIRDRVASCTTLDDAREVPLNDGNEKRCKVFVCATKTDAATTTARFRSYTTPGRDHFTTKATILQAARATSAATTFFDPVTIDGLDYIDGATGANNPSQEAWQESRDIWMRRKDDINSIISCFISIGCGHPGIKAIEKSVYGFLTQSVVAIATETERTTRNFREDNSELFRQKRCFRFNVEHGMEDVGLEEWKMAKEIRNAADEYLRNHGTGDEFEAVTERLMHKAYPMNLHVAFISKDAIKAFLDSLFYPHYRQRQESVKEAEQQSFAWIYSPMSFSRPQYQTPFPFWLEDASKVFWICGKPGAGKSTMMKRLAEDERTNALLSQWAGTYKVHIIAFFCYELTEDPLQKTVAGALRSLLYQILQRDDELAAPLFQMLSINDDRMPAWSPATLEKALLFVAALARERNLRLCFFVDGLDELPRSDWEGFVNILLKTHTASGGLMCVSSRPDLHLGAWTSHYCHLDMGAWNWGDIRNYAAEKLKALRLDEWVFREVAHRAEGVFLWAVLVVQRLLDENPNDDATVHECLAKKGLTQLFKELLARAERYEGSHMPYYFRVAFLQELRFIHHPSVALLTAARTSEGIEDYDMFAHKCELTARQIVTQSCGLLSVEDTPNFFFEIDRIWALPQPRLASNSTRSIWLPGKEVMSDRRLLPIQDVTRRVCRYMGQQIRWLHRSVHEYLSERREHGAFDALDASADPVIIKALLEGQIKVLLYGPVVPAWHDFGFTAAQQIQHFVEDIKSASAVLGFAADSLLDSLREQLPFIPPDDIGSSGLAADCGSYKFRNTPAKFQVLLPFWNACTQVGLYGYVLAHIPVLQSCSDSHWLLAAMAHESCHQTTGMDEENMNILHVDGAACNLIASLLGALKDKITVCHTSSEANRLEHGSITVSNGKVCYSGISWRGPETIDGLAISCVEMIASAWQHWCSCWDKVFELSQLDLPCGLSIIRVIQAFVPILENLQISTESRAWKGKHYPPPYSLEVSATSFPQTKLRSVLPQAVRERLGQADNSGRSTFRMVCEKDRKKRAVVWDVPAKFGSWSFHHESSLEDSERHLNSSIENLTLEEITAVSTVDFEDLIDYDIKFRHALIDAVWDNDGNQLDAWQQLLVLACIRTARNWGSSSKIVFAKPNTDAQRRWLLMYREFGAWKTPPIRGHHTSGRYCSSCMAYLCKYGVHKVEPPPGLDDDPERFLREQLLQYLPDHDQTDRQTDNGTAKEAKSDTF